MATSGKWLLAALVHAQDVSKFASFHLFPELFSGSELALYSFVQEHLITYKALPNPKTIEAKLGVTLEPPVEPPEYYLSEIENRYVQTGLKKVIAGSAALLNNQNPMAALDLMLEQVSSLNVDRRRNSVLDFRSIAEIIKAEYIKQKMMDTAYGMEFGWATLDEMAGGLGPGDVCSIVGRPASGKTFMGLSVAYHNWRRGRVPLFLSMEMTNIAIGQRLASVHSSTPLTQLLKGTLTTKSYGVLMERLVQGKTVQNPFWLLDGNLATTVDDLMLHCRQFNPSAVVIDGAYLLRHTNPKMSRFEKLTDNMERIKQRLATDCQLPVVCSFQFSREVSKKSKKGFESNDTAAGLEDIYGSDAIGQLSSVVLGMFEEESVSTLKRRRVDVLKGRNGETGKFLINWDFYNMDFSEIHTIKDANGNIVEDTSQLTFLG